MGTVRRGGTGTATQAHIPIGINSEGKKNILQILPPAAIREVAQLVSVEILEKFEKNTAVDILKICVLLQLLVL